MRAASTAALGRWRLSRKSLALTLPVEGDHTDERYLGISRCTRFDTLENRARREELRVFFLGTEHFSVMIDVALLVPRTERYV